jgi:hypothetical protein
VPENSFAIEVEKNFGSKKVSNHHFGEEEEKDDVDLSGKNLE